MTKERPPLSFNRALTRIAAVIGWDAAASICSVAERTIRNWSDPDTDAEISLRDALRLDLAYVRQGGNATPMADCYRLRLDVELGIESGCADARLAASAVTAKETGEAVAALIRAGRADATPADIRTARKESEEAIVALTENLSLLGTGEDE